MTRRVMTAIAAVAVAILSGCGGSLREAPSTRGTDARIELLAGQPVVRTVERWAGPSECEGDFGGGLVIQTGHYQIFTTLEDPLLLKRVPIFLESCWRAYAELAGVSGSADDHGGELLDVYLFESREEWEAFTRCHTGRNAEAYLKIGSGAYYANGACVAWELDRRSSFSVLAHEGWHQFSGRYFECPLPAWFDEGAATGFEAYQWEGGHLRFAAGANGGRLAALRETLKAGDFLPLAALLRLDAGQVLASGRASKGGVRPIDTYYAEVWALNRFLREYNYFQYYTAYRQILADGRRETWPLSAEEYAVLKGAAAPSRSWNARLGVRLFEHYIHGDVAAVEGEYLGFCRWLAAE